MSCITSTNQFFTITVNDTINQIIITPGDPCASQITLDENNNNVVEITHYGPQGPQGLQGPSGSSAPFIEISSGIWQTTSSIQITGSLNVTSGITGSLFGTSSWANNTITSSYAITASYALNGGGGGTPGGPDFSIQFNSGGFFSGSSRLYWTPSNNTLHVFGNKSDEGIHYYTVSGGLYLGQGRVANLDVGLYTEFDTYMAIYEPTYIGSTSGSYIYSNDSYRYTTNNSIPGSGQHIFTGSMIVNGRDIQKDYTNVFLFMGS